MKRRVLSLALALCLIMALVPAAATANVSGFRDLPTHHWAYPVIMNLARTGVINGFPDGTYRPEASVTREQFATLVVKLLQPEPTENEAIFKDVPAGSWANAWVTAAVRRGIVIPGEYGESLGAAEPITREEAAVWMVRGLGVDIGSGTPGFTDSGFITYKAEIAAAFEMGLVAGMPNNRFAPLESATRAQAAALVTNMSKILAEITPGNIEEVFYYKYRNDVTVIGNPPPYTITEEGGAFRILLSAVTYDMHLLENDSYFVLHPTAANPDGFAGYAYIAFSGMEAKQLGAEFVIGAVAPGSLEDIFEEFEYIGNIDLLRGDADFEVLPIEWNENSAGIFMQTLSGVPVPQASAGFKPTVRTTSREVIVNANNSTWRGINIEKCELTWVLPKIHANISISKKRADIYVTTAARLDFTASSSMAVNEVIPLCKIPVKLAYGSITIDVPVGIRVTANGEYRIEIMCSMDTAFGVMNNKPSAQVSFDYKFQFNHRTEAAMSLNIQAKASVFGIKAYGVQGDFGRGIFVSDTLQANCPARTCFVAETFTVRRIRSLTDWGEMRNVSLLRFDQNLARGLPRSLWYRTANGWQRGCPHGGATESLPPTTTVREGEIIQFGGYDWRVLDVQDDKALILSERILWQGAYTSTMYGYSTTWDNSMMRHNLGRFYDRFSESDKVRIEETLVINSDNQWYGTPGGNDTTDKIFLLSIEEVVRYFGDSGQLANGYPSNGAFISGARISDEYDSARIAQTETGTDWWWWLRSPGNSYYDIAFVDSGGSICIPGHSSLRGAFRSDGGVRPALWLNLSDSPSSTPTPTPSPSPTPTLSPTPAPVSSMPTAPQNLAVRAGNGRVFIWWEAPETGSPFTRYEVSDDNGFTWVTSQYSANHTFYGLINDTTYHFWVRAVNSAGNGAAATVTATPLSTLTNFYTLTLTAGTGGRIAFHSETISHEGRSGGTYHIYHLRPDTWFTLTAMPDRGFAFDGWYEGDTKINSSMTWTITATTSDRIIHARFVPG
jgi:hypothetical protein